MRFKTIFVILCWGFSIQNCSNEAAISEKSAIEHRFSNEPIYKSSEFFVLQKLYSIDLTDIQDYYITEMSWMDVDSDTNLYISDLIECEIHVFSKSGDFIKTIGGKGEGPNELTEPLNFTISEDRLYIYENHRGIKILDRNGKFIDYLLPERRGNGLYVKPVGDNFIGLYYLNRNNRITRSWFLEKYSSELRKIKTIVELDVDRFAEVNFFLNNILAINSDNHIFFPEQRDKYKIIKYDPEGNTIISFGRELKLEPYSTELRKWYNEAYKQYLGVYTPELPEYPPYVRYMFVDNRDYIWVVIGEWYSDNNSMFQLNPVIDIFNSKGDFITTLSLPEISKASFVKFDRLYTGPISAEFPKINVYQIKYLHQEINNAKSLSN